MKRLVDFIYEADMDDMKEFISKSIDDIDDEKTIKRIYEILKKSGLNTEIIDVYLKNRAVDDAKKSILSIIEANANLTEFYSVCNGEIELPTCDQLLANNNIYKVFDNLGFDMKTLEDLAELNLPRSGTARGYYEIISQLFLKDLSPENKGRGDVNAGGYSLEYKAPNARIRGRSLKSSTLIEQKFRKLIGNKVDFNSLPQKTGAMSSQSNINYLFKGPLKNESPQKMANIIGRAIYEQFKGSDEKLWLAFIDNHIKDIFPGNGCDSVNAKFIQTLFGVAGLYFYQHDEKFTHMILFKGQKKNNSGDYIVLSEDMFGSFESLYNSIKNLNVQFSSFPKTDGKISPQDEAIQIFVK